MYTSKHTKIRKMAQDCDQMMTYNPPKQIHIIGNYYYKQK